MQAIQNERITTAAEKIFALQQSRSVAMRTESVSNRKNRLEKLRQWIHANRPAIHEAAHLDFGKPAVEVDGVEIFHVLQEIDYAIKNLDKWTQPSKVDAPFTMLGTRSYIQYEPRGICLVISPWNYPFSLAVSPMVSALAAGNTVFLKPSELTPNMSALLSRMATDVFTPEVVVVFEGGPEVSQALLALPFNHIFFTGSPAVGKIVMKAAAETLASVTLELGGKSPTIITESANMKDAARRTAVAKFINNGQTCIAPDYVLVDEKVADRFIAELKTQIEKLFKQESETFETSTSYCRIVNDKHFTRLNALVQDALQKGARIEYGGKVDAATRFVHPMLVTHVSPESRLLEEEIFGPILPIITYKKIDEAIAFINAKPKPLALYVFSTSGNVQQKVLSETSAGAACINDCAIHFLHHGLPFGGVNNSGIGKSHGYYGFLAFSNEKPVLRQRRGLTSISVFYPPYTGSSRWIMDWFLKLF